MLRRPIRLSRALGGLAGSLGRRLLSAAVGLPLLLLVAWAGGLWVAVVAGLIAVWGLRELYTLASSAGYRPIAWAGTLAGLVLIASAFINEGRILLGWLGVGVALLLVFALLSRGVARGPGAWLATVGGAAAIGFPLAAAVLLRDSEQGREWLFLALLAPFAVDTSAYAVGRLWGRRRMAPTISPRKTWEGAAGGLAGGVGATLGLVAVLDLPLAAGAALALGIGISVVAQVGDLAESRLKRQAGVKESGSLIPGHGGLLDRMDSLVLVFPLVYYVGVVLSGA